MLGKINTFDALPMSFPFLPGKQALTLRGLPHFCVGCTVLPRQVAPAWLWCAENRTVRYGSALEFSAVPVFQLTLMDATQSGSQRGDTGTAEI